MLGPRFITKYRTRQGVLVPGKQLPMLIGVGVGAAGNGAFGWFVVRSARKILAPPPWEWQAPLDPTGVSPDSSLADDDNDGMDNDTL